ncbi:hypothetical protein K435DRAFT_772803 [Dendrothele bispora CBS 962.96]|uniref:ARM repeat-containing protein n=1 Tax=Dendrothele bispora (strain CBS 962.96) TaxID=1314807 RepID=A0A4S8MUY8_DENBC|nr:hypothetical protein K435DRAFT_772803 [Dendrothele bispora CBS 962.96]
MSLKLKFKDKLNTKGSSTDALLKKLKSLHTELASLDQDSIDTSSLDTVRKDLISSSILLHKDRGVKAYAACCLSDILRCYAPDAPYTQSQLRDIFQFFFTQLASGFKSPDCPYYNQYFHLLECLATVKSVVLICDLPNAEEIMTKVFKDFFALIRRASFSKKVELFMGDVLAAIIDESTGIPSSVLETLLAQFVDKNARPDQAAYTLAVRVCNETSAKLQRHVSSYFTDIILHHTPSSSHLDDGDDEDEDEDGGGKPDSSTKINESEILTAHTLIKRLYFSCPNLLLSVIPQLEEELQAENIILRGIATTTVGEMICGVGNPHFSSSSSNPNASNAASTSTLGPSAPTSAGTDLIKNFPSTFHQWLLRRNDKSSIIRLKWVESSRGLYVLPSIPSLTTPYSSTSSSQDLRDMISQSYLSKLLDPDDKVRAAVCRVFKTLDYETVVHHVEEKVLREGVGGRLADRKHQVRIEAAISLGRVFSLAYPEIENNDPIAIEKFSWIPNELLSVLGSITDARAEIEQVLADYIFPLPSASSTAANTTNTTSTANTNSTTIKEAFNKSSGKSTRSSRSTAKEKETPVTDDTATATIDAASGSGSGSGSGSEEIDPVAWTDRLLTTMRYLTPKSLQALLSISGLKSTRPTIYDVFVDACLEVHGGDGLGGGSRKQDGEEDNQSREDREEMAKRRLKGVIVHLAQTFPDPGKAREDLQIFAQEAGTEVGRKIGRVIKQVGDVEKCELKGLVKATNEFHRRLETLVSSSSSSSSSLTNTMTILFRRASLRLVNKSSIPTFLKRVAAVSSSGRKSSIAPSSRYSLTNKEKPTKTNLAAKHAQMLLELVGKWCPGMFKDGEVFERLVEALGVIEGESGESDDDDGDVEGVNERLVDVALQALAGVVMLGEKEKEVKGKGKGKGRENGRGMSKGKGADGWDGVELDRRVINRVKKFTLGSNYRHAKFAARVLAFSSSSSSRSGDDMDVDENCLNVVGIISETLQDVTSDRLVAHIAALGQFAKFCPDAFEAKSEVITSFLVKDLLMVPIAAGEDYETEDGDAEEEWVDDGNLSDNTRAKILALKCLRLRSMAHSGDEKALEIAKPVLKMLATVLDGNGSLVMGGSMEVEEEVKVLARMRLQAAVSLAHLSTVETYANALAPRFLRLALTVQDSCFEVRMKFLTKLIGLLQTRKLPARYNVIPFLTVHDPEDDVRNMASSYISASMKRLPAALRVQSIELIFVRLLHTLAHHPDFATTKDELVDIAKYVQFYLDLVLNNENLSLLYHLASKGKTVRDSEGQTFSENLYVMCELAQELIKNRAQQHSWNIPSYPGKLKLPSDILKPHPNAEIANKVVKQTYLPAEATSWLAAISAPAKEKKERKAPVKRKATTTTATNGHAPKRARKKRRQSAHTDDDEDEDRGTSDVDMTDANAQASSAGEEEVPKQERAKNQAQARAKRREARAKRAETPASSDA